MGAALDKYIELAKRMRQLPAEAAEVDLLIDEMDVVWKQMSDEEIAAFQRCDWLKEDV